LKRSNQIAFVAVCLAVLAATPFFGGEPVSFGSLSDAASTGYRLFFELRLPRFLAVVTAGASLALLGGTYQTLFQNPLAEPYLLGVSTAVTLGLAGGEILLGVSPQSVLGSSLGFLGAALVTLAILFLHRYRPRSELILFGMGTQFVLSSILILILSYHSQTAGGGSLRYIFGQVPWPSSKQALFYAGLSLPFLAGLFIGGRSLDALSLGDSVARTLGVSPERSRGWLLLLSSGLVALVVSFAGAIGFVGLVVPHAIRLVFRPSSTRKLFAASALLGATFLAFSDSLSRWLLPPMEFPIGVITTVIGGPLFLILLARRGT
jgi:iron complex transport system permease protein